VIYSVYTSHNTIVSIEILKVNGRVAEVSFSRQWAVTVMWSPAWVASVAVDGQRQQQEAAHDTACYRTHRDAIVQQRCIGTGGRYQRPYTQHMLQLTTSALRVLTSLTWLHLNFWVHENIDGRPFIKRFALCYRTVVCLSCLSVLSWLWRWCTVAKRFDGSRWNLACR